MQSLETGISKNSGSLHEEVLSKVRHMILQGELEPGSRIVERSLCERFKVSRTPLREAFKVLRSEGLVEILPNRGARVPTFRKREICDAMEIMAALEGLAGELAAERAADDVIADIRALHYQMFAHYLRAQVPEYFRVNQSIHRRIVEAAGNQLLTANHDALALRVMRARYLMNLWIIPVGPTPSSPMRRFSTPWFDAQAPSLANCCASICTRRHNASSITSTLSNSQASGKQLPRRRSPQAPIRHRNRHRISGLVAELGHPAYDYNGNMTNKTTVNGTSAYAWDFENRLSSVTLPSGAGRGPRSNTIRSADASKRLSHRGRQTTSTTARTSWPTLTEAALYWRDMCKALGSTSRWR